jgi:hypothetical protein
MLLASYALVSAAESRRVACRPVFHPVCHLVFRPVFHQIARRAYHLAFRQTWLLVFRPVCHLAELRTSLSAATVSPDERRAQKEDGQSGYRRRGETKAEAGGWKDSWCVGHRPLLRVVHPAALVRILGQLVSVPFPVLILVRNGRVQISRAPILPAWSEKKQEGVRKGVPLVEQSPQDARTRGRLVSPVPFEPAVGRSAGRDEASLKSETAAWARTEPRALAAHPSVSLADHRNALPVELHCAPDHRSFAVHVAFFPSLARTPAGNSGPRKKDRRAVRVFPRAVVSSTPC